MTREDQEIEVASAEASSVAGASCAAPAGSATVVADMLRAMDALWGALDAAHDMLSERFDQNDGRFVKMGYALGTAQDLLIPYFEHGKVVMSSQNDKLSD